MYFIGSYMEELLDKDGENLINQMNEILEQRNNIVIFSAFKNFAAYRGIPKDSELMRKLTRPEKSASALNSVRFLQSKILSRQELRRIYNETDDEIRMIFSFLYDTACRRNELLNIKFGDITFVNKEKDFSNIYAKINVMGKGQKSRTVYLGKTSYDLLMKLRPEQNKEDRVFVFYDSKGEELKKQDDKLYNLVKGTIRKILGRNMSVHSMRHTCLSHFASNGSDVLGISKYAGHANLQTSLIYIHTSDRVGKITFQNFAQNMNEGEI